MNEVKTWLANADNIGLGRLAIIEATVLSKFPDFDSFEGLGNGSFLKFLTSHKELLDAIEEVGGLAMARSGGQRTRLGHQVSLVSILDFISQCGTQTSLVSHLQVAYFICLHETHWSIDSDKERKAFRFSHEAHLNNFKISVNRNAG